MLGRDSDPHLWRDLRVVSQREERREYQVESADTDLVRSTNSGYPNCYSMTVYGSYPSADQSWLIRGCAGTAFKMSTIFREIITATSTKSSSKTASQASTPTNSGPAVTGPADNADNEDGSAGQVTAPPTGLPAATGTPQASTEGGSKAWIAGAVIGPIIGLALIGLVAFWLGRRRKAANENHNIAVAGDAKTDPSVADQSSMHPSVYYGAGSPGMGSPGSPPIGGKYYQGEPPSGINSTPSPVNGYQPMYQQQPAAYGGAGYPPPQQGHYPPQHSPQPSSYSPQPYPAQFAVPPPPLDRYQSPHNAAELPSAPMRDAPQELGDGAPVRR
ncbi:hypothetical protein QBC39DRAFT_363004 [Podospora conica]|nr:hypothetical protein QBC39DRAFT_363004 [Schizothecium conicum]